MKKLFLILIAVAGLAGCRKADLAGNESTGEGLVPFSLKTPTSGTNLVLNAATPNQTVEISWNPSTPGLNTPPSYRWIAALKSTGNLESPIISIPSGNAGKDTKLTLTYKQLDDALKAAGIAEGAKTDLIWSIEADNGSTKLIAQNNFNLSVTRFKDGASPFSILGPMSSTSALTINPGSTTDSVRFNWTRSQPGTPGGSVRYRVFFYKDDAAMSPLFSMPSNRGGADTVLSVSNKAFSDSLLKYGFTNMSAAANIKWNVSATSATWTQMSDYTNQFSVLREVNLFLVGGATPIGWTPTNALQFIQDEGREGIYYIYTFLTTGNNGFKLLSMKADWSAAGQTIYGEVNGADGSGNSGSNNTGALTTSGGGNNIAVPGTSGVYRITVDLPNNKYYVQKEHGRMGLVGGGTTAGWTPSAVFPSQEMGFLETNLFLGITNVTQDGEFKMLDNSDWPNGNLNYTRDYEDGGGGVLKENGGPNFKWTSATGPVRVIWDYRNVKQPRYMVNSASEMRVVGDGISGVAAWSPGASPQMTYAGNGKWTITLDLVATKDIKFLAGNDWGAFDYEDAGSGKIRWDGDNNFKTPGTGSYTITLDEYKGTVTYVMN